MNISATLSPKEKAVWLECNASQRAIDAITAHGGFQSISESLEKQLDLQDILDGLMVHRIIKVRNAMRKLGWGGDRNSDLTKEIFGSQLVFSQKTQHIGSGRNVPGVSYLTFMLDGMDDNKDEIIDDMTLTASEMALGIERRIVMLHGLEMPKQSFSSETLRQAIPDTDGSHGIGFRDALESMMIALQAKQVDSAVIHEVIATALDAYANNDTLEDVDPALKLCAQVARMSTYEDGIDENGDAVDTMNRLIMDARAIINGQDVDEAMQEAPLNHPH